MFEIHKISSIPSLSVFWVLDVSCIVCILTGNIWINVGFILGRIIHLSFDLEERISQSFSITLAFPSLGALPLIISKLLCSSGGPLEGEPNCENVNGLMIFNFVINAVFLFLLGFILVGKDKHFSDEINEKLSFLWHVLMKKMNLDDNFIMIPLQKYLPDKEELGNEIYEKFHENFILECDNKYNYHLTIKHESLTSDQISALKKVEENGGKKDLDQEGSQEDHLHENDNFEEEKINISFAYKEMQMLDKMQEENNENMERLESKGNLFQPRKHHKTMWQKETRKMSSIKSEPNLRKNITKPNLIFDVFKIYENNPEMQKNLNVRIIDPKVIQSLNNSIKPLSKKAHSKQISVYSIFDHFREDSKDEEDDKLNFVGLQEINHREEVNKYYNVMYEIIAQHLSFEQTFELYVDKAKVLQNLNKTLPIFPIVEGISINRGRTKIIDEEWGRFNDYINERKIDINLNTKVNPITAKIVMSKIFSPPIIGCFIGMLIGVANMSNILNSSNHYFSNMKIVLTVCYKAFVPLVMITTGVTMFATKGLNINMPFTKYHLMITFVVRGLIIPWLGIGYMYLWVHYFGGVVLKDKVVRLAMYIPWALPSAQNYTIVVNLLQYYNEELGYVLKWHNALIFVTITLNLLIYFSLIGLYPD
jgi:hypothetical protein